MATSNPDYYEMVLAEHEAELAKNIQTAQPQPAFEFKVESPPTKITLKE